jgi:hypothetical protein
VLVDVRIRDRVDRTGGVVHGATLGPRWRRWADQEDPRDIAHQQGQADDNQSDLAKQRVRPWHEVGSLLPEQLNGWFLVDVDGYGSREGEYEVNNPDLAHSASGPAKDPAEVTVTWRPYDQYEEYLADRRDVSRPEPVEVADFPAKLFTYGEDDFTALLRLEAEETFIELRGTFVEREDFEELLGTMQGATGADFDRALNDAGLTVDAEGNG